MDYDYTEYLGENYKA